MDKKEILEKAKLAASLIEDKESRVILGLLIEYVELDIEASKPQIGFAQKDNNEDRKA